MGVFVTYHDKQTCNMEEGPAATEKADAEEAGADDKSGSARSAIVVEDVEVLLHPMDVLVPVEQASKHEQGDAQEPNEEAGDEQAVAEYDRTHVDVLSTLTWPQLGV